MSPTKQRAVALSKANGIRSARAAEKNRIKALPRDHARVRVADILENPEPEFRTIRLGELLVCIPRVHHSYAGSLLSCFGLHMDVRLRDLKVRQRIGLGEHLRSGDSFPQQRRRAA